MQAYAPKRRFLVGSWVAGAALGIILVIGSAPAQAAPPTAAELESSGVRISVEILPLASLPGDGCGPAEVCPNAELAETGFAPLMGAVSGTLVLGAGLTAYVSVRRRRRVVE